MSQTGNYTASQLCARCGQVLWRDYRIRDKEYRIHDNLTYHPGCLEQELESAPISPQDEVASLRKQLAEAQAEVKQAKADAVTALNAVAVLHDRQLAEAEEARLKPQEFRALVRLFVRIGSGVRVPVPA